VIYALLMAMSNLEPAAFNYLAVRGERGSTEYENLARLRIQGKTVIRTILYTRRHRIAFLTFFFFSLPKFSFGYGSSKMHRFSSKI
jgi:hypothetical protein